MVAYFWGGVVFLPKFMHLSYAVNAAAVAFMTLAFCRRFMKKKDEKKRKNLLSTVLGMSTMQGSAQSLKACMVLVDTALYSDCSLANYCHIFYFFHFQHFKKKNQVLSHIKGHFLLKNASLFSP